MKTRRAGASDPFDRRPGASRRLPVSQSGALPTAKPQATGRRSRRTGDNAAPSMSLIARSMAPGVTSRKLLGTSACTFPAAHAMPPIATAWNSGLVQTSSRWPIDV